MVLPSESNHVNHWLKQASEKENIFDWDGAAEAYAKASKRNLAIGDFLKAGETQEKIGLCFHRAAFQSNSPHNFQRYITASGDAYQKGIKLYSELVGDDTIAKATSCEAKLWYIKSWLERNRANKIRLLRRSCALAYKALETFKIEENSRSIIRTYNDLIVYLDKLLEIAEDEKVRACTLRKADYYCEKAIEESMSLGDTREIALSYLNAGHHFFATVFLKPLNENTERNRQRTLGYLHRAIELLKDQRDAYLSIVASLDFARIAYSRITMEPELAIKHFSRLLRQANKLKDHYIAARAAFRLALSLWWMIRLERDLEAKRQWYKKCIDSSSKSMHYASLISDDCGIALGCWLKAYAIIAFVEELETRPEKRKRMLSESLKIARTGVKHAKRSGELETRHFAEHTLSLSLFFLSETERKTSRKSQLLKRAFAHGNESIRIATIANPFDLWNLGIYECFQALILLNQSIIETDIITRNALQKSATLHWTKGQNSGIRYLALYPDTKRYWGLGGLCLKYGANLNRLYSLTQNSGILPEIVKVYSQSISMFREVGLDGLVAQAHWQISKALDLQGEFFDSAQHFEQASISFCSAAEKTPLLKYWLMDNALYMKAWKEIEEAKSSKKNGNLFSSAEHYRKASVYLQETLKWRYLSPYYKALSLVQLVEHHTKKHQFKKARIAFDEATSSFEQAEMLLKGRESFAESSEEKEEIEKLAETSRQYLQSTKAKHPSSQRQEAFKKSRDFVPLTRYPESPAGLNAFEDACIRARISAPHEFALGKAIRIIVDIVNVGKKPGVLVRIENLLPPSLSLLEITPRFNREGASLNLKGKILPPLQMMSLNIKVRPSNFGVVELSPRVTYLDYHGDFAVHNVEAIEVQPMLSFKSKSISSVFEYLLTAFRSDYIRRLPAEESGWRTRTQIIKKAKGINKRHVYGKHGQLGPSILRLHNLGLIEISEEKGKRGRGGRLLRVRIAYKKEEIRKQISQDIGSSS